ncbi:MAG: trimeric intracellular cation channel family protein [Bacteroidota bacterium]
MTWLTLLDLLGTLTFAISGVLTAMDKKFDLVGTLIIGFVTAIGGGTIRDILIGRLPAGWMEDRNYFFVILFGYALAYLFKRRILKLKKSMFLFDTIGIGLFTILGVQIALQHGLRIEVCLILGVITASFGGVLRDVLTNEIPLIFRQEIYATACFIGGLVYLLLNHFSDYENMNIVVSIFVVILIRYLSIRFQWSLNFNRSDDIT